MDWTIALDRTAFRDDGGPVADYYLAPNHGRQNNILTLVDVDDQYRYWINHNVNDQNELVITPEGGSGINTGIAVDDTNLNFLTLSLTYTAATGTAILDYGSGTTAVASASADPGRNAVFFGAGNSAGQGSAVWNAFSVSTVPEPTVPALMLAGGLLLRLRLRHR